MKFELFADLVPKTAENFRYMYFKMFVYTLNSFNCGNIFRDIMFACLKQEFLP